MAFDLRLGAEGSIQVRAKHRSTIDWAPGCLQNAATLMTNNNNDSHHHYGFWLKDLMDRAKELICQ